jgi:hypothetical protein
MKTDRLTKKQRHGETVISRNRERLTVQRNVKLPLTYKPQNTFKIRKGLEGRQHRSCHTGATTLCTVTFSITTFKIMALNRVTLA